MAKNKPEFEYFEVARVRVPSTAAANSDTALLYHLYIKK